MDIIPQDGFPRKQCTTCPNIYPATPEYFSRDKDKKDGLRTQCKECRKQYRLKNRERDRLNSLRYADEHREEKRAYDRQYVAERREERNAYSRQYSIDNKELIREKRKIHYREHKEEENEKSRNYYRANKETYRARKKHYHATHKEKGREWARRKMQRPEYREYQRRYGKYYRQTERGRKICRSHEQHYRAIKSATPGMLTAQQIALKLRSQRYRCYYCQRHFEKRKGIYIYHLEHTIPLSRAECAPRHDINFTVLACPTCNLRKGKRLPHEWPEGGRLF